MVACQETISTLLSNPSGPLASYLSEGDLISQDTKRARCSSCTAAGAPSQTITH